MVKCRTAPLVPLEIPSFRQHHGIYTILQLIIVLSTQEQWFRKTRKIHLDREHRAASVVAGVLARRNEKSPQVFSAETAACGVRRRHLHHPVDLSAGRQMEHATTAKDGTPHAALAIDADPVRQAASIIKVRKLPTFA